MSADALSPPITHFGIRWTLRELRILRYAIGSTLCVAVAMGFDWFLGYIVPVLALGFFAKPAPRPSLRQGAAFILVIFVASLGGYLFARYALPYPLVFLGLAGLGLLHLFYAKQHGVNALLLTWLLIAITVVPLLSMQSLAVAAVVIGSIVTGAIATMALIWVTYGLFPDPPSVTASLEEAETTGDAALPPVRERLRSALLSTAVVLPLYAFVYSFQLTGSLLILIFVAMLSQQPDFATDFKRGAALILGNAVGGIAAIFYYEVLVMAPEFGLFLLLVLLAGFVFGTRVFSGKPTAPIYGMAYSTLLLVICSTTSSSAEADAKAYSRVIQITLAVVYVVGAFGVLNRFFPRSRA